MLDTILAEGPHTVRSEWASARLSDFVIEKFESLVSASGARKAIKRGRIRLNGVICADTGRRLKQGDCIELLAATAQEPQEKVKLELSIVFEDTDFIAVIKPAGIETRGHRIRTLEHAVFHQLSPWDGHTPVTNESSIPPLLSAPTAVHRLDYETTGLVLLAKSERALPALSQLFQKRQITKSYQAIVQGLTPEKGELTSSVDGLQCHSHFQRLAQARSLQNQWLSHLELTPTSGRRHQLRKQLSELGHPIVGDSKYSEPGRYLKGKGLFLAATGLCFEHPFTSETLKLSAPLPRKFQSLLEREARRWTQFRSKDSLPE